MDKLAVNKGKDGQREMADKAEKAKKAEKPKEDPRPAESAKASPGASAKLKPAEKPNKAERPKGPENQGIREADTPKARPSLASAVLRSSPIEEHIAKAMAQEEEELEKCRSVLAVMQAAARRQPTISADVKRGIILLEESFSVMASLRTSWKAAEKAKGAQARRAEEDVPRVPAPSTKRAASSPAEENEARKKKKEDEPAAGASWAQVVSKKQKRAEKKKKAEKRAEKKVEKQERIAKPRQNGGQRAMMKKRSAAITIKPATGNSYAEVLKDIKSKVRLGSVGADIRAIRQARDGNVLLELGAKTKDPAELRAVLAMALGDSGTVKSLTPRSTVEMRDLGCLTEKEEVEEALKRDLGDIGEVKVSLTKPNPR